MGTGTGPRTQAERDALTIEIGYAVLSAAFLGAVVFGVIAGPVLVWHLPRAVEETLPTAGLGVAVPLAVIRMVHVLWRFARPGAPGAQPSRPGRTNPDS
ncbi:DUF6332 family protein [Streptomyces sp. GC420]|uniref:DUF6332 family protein n=1 Tax=Streptomyces sp. GC420 TaxID=2697568 RepID=UPI00141530A1|nr:DUF6332 family protein [Streptomyces sp. GC420]NBM14748.1 hypothetical protein [Streptomyces sp. GC420]